MGTLWETGDTMHPERRNREAVIGRLLMPLYDVDDSDVITLTPVTQGVVLGSTIGTIWTVPASGIVGALVTSISLLNTDSVARYAYLYLVEPGATAASVARTIFLDQLQPGERVSIRVPITLAPGALIRGLAEVASYVSVRVDATTFVDQPTGLTLKVVEGVALTDSLVTIYTCPAVQQALLLSAIMCNTDASSRVPELHVIPSGDVAVVANQIWKDTLVARETAALDDVLSLEAGGFIQAKASVTGVGSLRLSILEVS